MQSPPDSAAPLPTATVAGDQQRRLRAAHRACVPAEALHLVHLPPRSRQGLRAIRRRRRFSSRREGRRDRDARRRLTVDPPTRTQRARRACRRPSAGRPARRRLASTRGRTPRRRSPREQGRGQSTRFDGCGGSPLRAAGPADGLERADDVDDRQRVKICSNGDAWRWHRVLEPRATSEELDRCLAVVVDRRGRSGRRTRFVAAWPMTRSPSPVVSGFAVRGLHSSPGRLAPGVRPGSAREVADALPRDVAAARVAAARQRGRGGSR